MSEQHLTILTTKLMPSRLGPERVLRFDLIEQLKKAQSCSLCLIMGPAGYGKSTLLAQLSEEMRNGHYACGWLTLDTEDNAIGQFLRYLSAAIKRMAPEISVHVEDAEESFLYHPKQMIINIINALAQSNGRYALFLDDYHEINDPLVDDTVQFLLEQLPENVNIYMGSRHLPQFSIEKLKIQQLVYLMGSESLRFNKQDVSEFLLKTHNIVLSEKDNATFFKKTQGWPAATMLASQILLEDEKRHNFLSSDENQPEFVDLLVSEVLEGLSKETLKSLLKISIVDRFCSDLAIELTHDKGIITVIDNPKSSGYLIQIFDDNDTWYSFHPLIRNYLRNRLKQDLGDQVASLNIIASTWFEQKLLIREAVNHASEAQDESRILNLLEMHADDLMQQGYSSVLISLVNRLTLQSSAGAERILVPIAWAQILNYNLEEANLIIESIVNIINIQDDASLEIQAKVDTMRCTIFSYQENIYECELLLNRWQDRIPDTCNFEKAVMANLCSYVAINHFDFHKVSQCQKIATDARLELNSHGAEIYGLLFSGMAYARQAQLSNALNCYDEARKKIQNELGQESFFKQITNLLIATIKYQLGELDSARSLIENNIEAARLNGFPDLLVELLPVMVEIYQQDGDLRKVHWAISMGQRMSLTRHSIRLNALMLYQNVKLAIRCEDMDKAKKLLDDWETKDIQPTMIDQIFVEQANQYIGLAQARLDISQGKCKQVIISLNFIHEYFVKNNLAIFSIESGLLLVEALIVTKHIDQANRLLINIINITNHERPLQVYINQNPRLIDIINDLDKNSSNGGINQFIKLWVSLSKQQRSCNSNSDFNILSKKNIELSPEKSLIEPLSKREVDILINVAQGMSNKQVSAQLFISTETVKSHLKSIYSKMGVSRRTQAVSLGLELKII